MPVCTTLYKDMRRRLGLEHTMALLIINNLGLLYVIQGKLDEAEKLYQRVLQGYEKALVPNVSASILLLQ